MKEPAYEARYRPTLGFLQLPAGRGAVFEPGAAENFVESKNLLGRYTLGS